MLSLLEFNRKVKLDNYRMSGSKLKCISKIMLNDIVYQEGKIKLGSKLKCDSIVKYAILREVCQLNIIGQ